MPEVVGSAQNGSIAIETFLRRLSCGDSSLKLISDYEMLSTTPNLQKNIVSIRFSTQQESHGWYSVTLYAARRARTGLRLTYH